MSNNLENQAPADTFKSILQTGNNEGLQASLTPVEDGAGVQTPLSLSASKVAVSSDFSVSGDFTVSGTQTIVNTETVEIKDHNLVIGAGTNYADLDVLYPGTEGAYAGIIWGDGDTGAVSPVRMTYKHDVGFSIEGGDVAVGGTIGTAWGTAAAPGHSFYNGSNMGMFRPAVNELGFSTSSTERIRIDSDGNVGIGTTNPARKLHVADGFIRVDDGYGIDTSGSTEKIVLDNGFISLTTNSNEAMRIDSAGNVGIGTTSPDAALHISNASATTLILERDSSAGPTAISSIVFKDGSSDQTRISSTDSGISFDTGAGNTNRMKIDSDGNVGIGTTNPSAVLHVDGDSTNLGGLMLGHAGGAGIDSFRFYIDSNNKAHITRGASEKITILSDGNIGIGTNAPQGPLHLKNSDSNACRIYLENAASTSPIHSSIYSVGDDIQIDAGINLPGIRIADTGKVGIGTTNPTNALNVVSSSGAGVPVAWIHNSNNTESGDHGTVISTIHNHADINVLSVRSNNSTHTNGNPLFTVKGDGKVGIGTTDPKQLLHLEGQVPRIRLQDNNPTSDGIWDIMNNNSVFTLQHREADDTNISNYFNVLSNGNVGIGTTDPDLSLDVNGGIQMQGDQFWFKGGSFRFIDRNTGSSLERMRIDSSGNVGIGTTNPDQNLHIEVATSDSITSPDGRPGAVLRLTHDAQWESSYSGGSNPDFLGGIEFESMDTSTGTGVRAAIKTTVDHYANDNSLAFYTAPVETAGVVERMRIDSAGNVGIGTANPNRTFEVAGNIRATKRSVDGGDIALDLNVGGSADHPVLNIYDKDGNAWLSATGGSVGIGTTSPSAPLEVSSTTGGVIMPRMNNAQMLAITSPTPGEMVFNTTDGKFYGYDGTNNWVALH